MTKPPFTTVSQAAAILGVSDRRVRAICDKHSIGTMITPRQRLLTADDVARLKTIRLPVGRNLGERDAAAKAKKPKRAKTKRVKRNLK